ncbi:LysR family transcriptional regulator [Limobrevibacterium gyesilva]|uniref:LysR family transcriptional regulator n=1 Tax=Limobrevibacterium gyesilva TaxID=2991712 RepID=A0AA41YRM2_9PROT|nr:LysR family transcriptional regulator [Limobrevibacterium gyesilva]MCW3475328.1 LysR family transcriptional regulator [Limobrevibacterium gyesilva]
MTISAPGTPTLDQLRVLAEVVDAGSFSAAARRLNRAQSVVSYSVAALEGQLGLQLFQRGHRRPMLTEAGRAVLADARRIGLMMDELRARAAGLTHGLESEVSLAVDVMFPTGALVAALQDFAGEFPTVALRLRIEALGGVVQLVLDGSCGLGISSWLATRFDALDRRQIAAVEMVPVAAPCHPLVQVPAPIPAAALRDHVQLVLTDRSPLSEGQDFAVLALRTWRLADLGAKHALLHAGLGWGNMPEPMVREDLATGRLVRLVLADAEQRPYPLFLIHRTDAPPGPAASWLGQRLSRVEEAAG